MPLSQKTPSGRKPWRLTSLPYAVICFLWQLLYSKKKKKKVPFNYKCCSDAFFLPFCRQMPRISRSLACFKDSYLVSGYVRKIQQKVEKVRWSSQVWDDQVIFVPSYYENLVTGPLRASGWINVAFIHFIITIIFETQIHFPGPKNASKIC